MTSAEYLRYFSPANRLRGRGRRREGLAAVSGSEREKIQKKREATWTIPPICVHRLRCLNKRPGLLCHHWLLLGGVLSLNLLETSPKKESERLKAEPERTRGRARDKYNTRTSERGTRYLKHRQKKDKETELRGFVMWRR